MKMVQTEGGKMIAVDTPPKRNSTQAPLDFPRAAKEEFGRAVDHLTSGAMGLSDAALWACVPGWFASELNKAIEEIRAIRDRLDRLAGGSDTEYGAYRWRR